MEGKKNVAILVRMGLPDTEPYQLQEWCKKSLPSLNVVVVHGPRELIAQGISPDDVDVLILWLVFRPMLEFFLSSCTEKKRLKWIQCNYAGIDVVLCPAIVNDPEITMTIATGLYNDQLGEWVIAAIMYWEKFIPRLQAQQKAHVWNRFTNQELRGKNMCVVGFGSIGQNVGKKATALGVHVTGIRRRPVSEAEETTTVSSDVAERVVGLDKLMEILPTSDYVVLVLPLTKETMKSFGAKQFEVMKNTAIFVNIGRGQTVDYEALYDALHEHKIAYGSIDVSDPEPLPPTSKLWDLENILISPHSAVLTPTANQICCDFIKENLTRYVEGKPLLNIAKKQLGY